MYNFRFFRQNDPVCTSLISAQGRFSDKHRQYNSIANQAVTLDPFFLGFLSLTSTTDGE